MCLKKRIGGGLERSGMAIASSNDVEFTCSEYSLLPTTHHLVSKLLHLPPHHIISPLPITWQPNHATCPTLSFSSVHGKSATRQVKKNMFNIAHRLNNPHSDAISGHLIRSAGYTPLSRPKSLSLSRNMATDTVSLALFLTRLPRWKSKLPNPQNPLS